MNELIINDCEVDVIILKDGRTIKMPVLEELSISALSSNKEQIQTIDIVAHKGRTVVSGITFNKKTIDNVKGYTDDFLPHIGDKVFYNNNQIGEIYSFKSDSEIFIKAKGEYILTHIGELTFIHRKITFVDKLKNIFK